MDIDNLRPRPIGDLHMPSPPAGMAERWGFAKPRASQPVASPSLGNQARVGEPAPGRQHSTGGTAT